jgi:flagellar hook-associated protein 1 FlgK
MVSLFGILNMAGQSLSVETDASAVTGQNLTNVNNPAYARQQVNMQTATPLQTTIGQEGTGVQAVSITEVRDALLDAQITAEDSVSGSLTSQQSALQNAEAYLNETLSGSTSAGTSSPNGLTALFSSFYGSLQTLSADPSNVADRQAVVQAAQQLAGQFNSVSSGLATVTSNLNTAVSTDVASANQDLSQIAALNQQIIQAQAIGGTANDLVDKRQKLIEDLAGKANIATSAQTDGAVNVSINGVSMVAGISTVNSLATYTDAHGNLQVMDGNSSTPITLTGGSIEGEISARDGAVSTLASSINQIASQLMIQFNSVYSTGYDLHGNTGQAFFSGSSAANMAVNAGLISDPTTFQAAGTTGNPGDNTVVLALANSANQTIAGLNNQTFTQNYAATVGAFGSSLQSVNEDLSNSAAVSQMLSTQRSSTSGVDTDTEMTNLLQFQKAYQASAELITTVNQMLETLLTMKTE